LAGFKEVKQNTDRSRDLNNALSKMAEILVEMKTRIGYLFADHFIFSQTTFYLLLAAMVFVVPGRLSGSIMKITTAILFMFGPLSSLIGTLPLFSLANVAVGNMRTLEARLEQLESAAQDRDDAKVVPPPDFREVSLSRVRFEYRDREGKRTFRLGPLDLTIHKGEIVFLVGGNGSGKSTFLKLLTALYYPEEGKVLLDGQDVAEIGYASYRNLFSAIFSDYHLFDSLYGLRVSDAEVNQQLKELGLEGKTKCVGGRLTNLDLSTGQRKRIGLLVSLLEDRQIYIFDEWAAEQDASFRDRFYRKIIRELQARQKTVIVATHDEQYFQADDRVLEIKDGRLKTFKIDPARRSVWRRE
jgi:putative ATP-binding cassette transporter